jgi:hypothetical protein
MIPFPPLFATFGTGAVPSQQLTIQLLRRTITPEYLDRPLTLPFYLYRLHWGILAKLWIK